MRILMGIVLKKGVYVARKRVPQNLQKAVGKAWLHKSLGTKDLRRANVAAKAPS
jgi:hypothetical protein